MSFAQPTTVERRPSPGLTLNLASNNPFRRAVSPAATSPGPRAQGFSLKIDRLPATNPFLDTYQGPQGPASFPLPVQNRPQMSPPRTKPAAPLYRGSPRQPAAILPSELLISGLSLSRTPTSEFPPRTRDWPLPSSGGNPLPSTHHKPSRSQDGARDVPVEQRAPRKTLPSIFASPEKTERIRPRRNSESSISFQGDERKLRERRGRERDGKSKEKDAKARESRTATKPKKPNPKMDLIDKLDLTSIYGTGLFHHDGPFDACNPHRNRKGARAAPMQAFPEGSANNAIGGSGPVNKAIDLERFHGRGAEGFTDYNVSAATYNSEAPAPIRRPAPERAISDRPVFSERSASYVNRPTMQEQPAHHDQPYFQAYDFDPKAPSAQVHGQESFGLGTSTFLEGAPAPVSRVAAQSRPSELDAAPGPPSGLQRKKSLAQKIRGMSRQRPAFGDAGRVTSPEAQYVYLDNGIKSSPNSPKHFTVPDLPRMPQLPQSAGGRQRFDAQEVNPFFDDENSRKDAGHIRISETFDRPFGRPMRNRTMSSPQNPLERNITNESSEAGESEARGMGGLLSRVKSMRAGRRPRPDRRESEAV